MESDGVKELSKLRFEKALSDISVAKQLFETGNYGAALNRAYYSAFDSMKAVNAIDGFDSSKQIGVISHFNQEYVKSGIFPISTSGIVKKASMLREKSDYEDFYEPEKDDVIDIISKVEEFLKDTETYLRSLSVI